MTNKPKIPPLKPQGLKTEKQQKDIPMKYNKATGWIINKDVK